MGKVIKVNFKKKSKAQTKKSTLDFPMVFHEAGWGLNPRLLQRIYVTLSGTLFFFFNKTGKEPQAALYMSTHEDGVQAAEQLVQCIAEQHGNEVKIIYE